MPSTFDVYRGIPVAVTGHTGFKGTWLAHWLEFLGAKVSGFALPPESAADSMFVQTKLARRMDSVYGDIMDMEGVRGFLSSRRPQIVFHLAAQSLVRRSYAQPLDTFAVNVMGLVNVLTAVREMDSVRALVVVTTDKCYENDGRNDAGFRETDPLGGSDPYSASKACAEIVCASYRTSFFGTDRRCAIATARAGNVIGGGDWAADRLIPDIIHALMRDRPVVIRNPAFIRPWQYVLEPLRGYLDLGERLYRGQFEFAEAWNFGPHQESVVTVLEIAERVISQWGAGAVDIRSDPHAPKEAASLRLDVSKASARLGFNSILSLREALDETTRWYEAFLRRGADAGDLTQSCLQRYIDRVASS